MRFVIFLVIVCSSSTGIDAARAQRRPPPIESSPPPPPTAEDAARAAARPHFERGLALIAEQRWSEALESFLAAEAIFASPILRFNVGYCQRALGQYVAALATFDGFLAAPLEGLAATRRAEAEGYAAELRGRIARIVLRAPAEDRAILEVDVDGRRVELGNDGSATLAVDPGHHSVAARRPGFAPYVVDHDLRPGEAVELSLDLEELPAALVVTSNLRDAEVLLDGSLLGRTPFDREVRAGRYRLVVAADDHVPHEAELNIAPGQTARVRAELTPEPVSLAERWWFWTGIGVIVAGATVATYALTRPEPEPPPYDGGNLGWVID